MKLQDGSDAKGVLGESATPFCGDGFEASGTSECALDVLKKNGWNWLEMGKLPI